MTEGLTKINIESAGLLILAPPRGRSCLTKSKKIKKKLLIKKDFTHKSTFVDTQKGLGSKKY